jgi:threonyl-tRNA synthetase
LAIGMKEVEDRSVSLRRLGETQTRSLGFDAVVAELGLEALPPAGA